GYSSILSRQARAKFFGYFFLEICARPRHRGKLVHPLIGAAGIDKRAGLNTSFARRDNRVDGIAPATPHNIDVLHRIGSGAEGPKEFIAVPNIDVVIDDDNV